MYTELIHDSGQPQPEPERVAALSEVLLEDEADARKLLSSLVAAIDPAIGLISSLELEEQSYADEPQFIAYQARLRPTHRFSDGGYSIYAAEGGRAAAHDHAQIRAIMEALERYALSVYTRRDLVICTYDDMCRRTQLALDPVSVASVETVVDQDERNRLRASTLAWKRGWSYRHGTEIFVPAQLVYVPYKFVEGERLLRDPITTGAAAGLARGKAIQRGLLEVIERDATTIVHYLARPAPRVSEHALRYGTVHDLLRRLRRYGFDVALFDFTLDFPVPVVVARIIDPSGNLPCVTLASKASFDVCLAAEGAALEAACFRRAMRAYAHVARERAVKLRNDFSAIDSGEQRSYFVIQPEMLKSLQYLESEPGCVDRSVWHGQCAARTRALAESVLTRGGDVVVVDVTPPDVRSLGVVVVKVIVPSLQPMHLCENSKTWTKRILRFGLNGAPRTVDALNPVPHPFL